jgi:transposase
MKLHGNARTCPNSRRLLIDRVSDQSWSIPAAAQAAGISERSAYRWLARWREQGAEGLMDRSSAPSESRIARLLIECRRSQRSGACT